MTQKVKIYTDGGCNPNPGKGGMGVYIELPDGANRIYCDGRERTTNNQMEMDAAILGLEKLKLLVEKREQTFVEVFTNSQYLIDGITKWINGWKSRDWMTKENTPVKNKDLWQQLDSLRYQFAGVRWQWVKGHSGNVGNEFADVLAAMGRDLQQLTEPTFEQVDAWHSGNWKFSDGPLPIMDKHAEAIKQKYEMGGVW